MKRLLQLGAGVCVAALLSRWLYIWFFIEPFNRVVYSKDDIVGHVPLNEDLVSFVHESGEPPQFNKVTEGVYVATGFSISNSIIIDARDGLIVVDTTESLGTAKQVRCHLQKIVSKPITNIIYTHHHSDHTKGAQAFIDDLNNPPDIWAHESFMESLNRVVIAGPKYSRGFVYQFGSALNGARAWPPLHRDRNVIATRLPNRLIHNDIETLNLSGENVTFLHLPGETDDHLAVWLPDRRVLLPGDNIYKAFPNLYAIRGTASRHILDWARSIHKMRGLNVQFLVPSHGKPVLGAREIDEVLVVYSAAIQYIHDQTVRHMNQQKHPLDIARLVELPHSMASHPYLRQMYGRVDWSVRRVYESYVGWFSGDAVDLLPLNPTDRSHRLVNMIGVDRLMDEAESALLNSDSQWALELSTDVLRVEPSNLRARRLRLNSLRSLAARHSNPVARNFYLTTALDDHGLVNWDVGQSAMLEQADIDLLHELMKVNLKAELADDVNMTLYFLIDDVMYEMQVLYSVLTVTVVDKSSVDVTADITLVTTTEHTWRQVLIGKVDAVSAFSSGQLVVSRGTPDSVRVFLSLFGI